MQASSADFSGRVHVHLHRHDQSIDSGPQRTEIARDPFGQHRNRPSRKINTVAPKPRVAVKSRSGFNEMRYVGDRHPQSRPPRLGRLHANRIVVIPGGFRVNGDKKAISQVEAAAKFSRVDGARNCLRLKQRFGRELRGKPAIPRHGTKIGFWIARSTESLNHA